MKSAEVTKQNCETSNKEKNKNKLQKIKLKNALRDCVLYVSFLQDVFLKNVNDLFFLLRLQNFKRIKVCTKRIEARNDCFPKSFLFSDCLIRI